MQYRAQTLQEAIASLPGQRIMVCPLNWGLGHATRCVPVIHEIERQGKTAVIAAYGESLLWLQQEFHSHEILEFPGVTVTYSKGESQVGAMLRALPTILRDIRREHRQLTELIRTHHIDAIISDNRFGLFTDAVPCVYMTHQLMIKMPQGMTWLEPLGHWLHHRFIRRYNACWVPDHADEPSLSGALSHRFQPSEKTVFIGPLSRFQEMAYTDEKATENHLIRFEAAAILSGPEPQRTLLEEALMQQFLDSKTKALIVCGQPKNEPQWTTIENVTKVSHLESQQISRLIQTTPELYCRSGYTTLMDLDVLQRTAILIPTPGQTEQEYLAEIAVKRGFKWMKQGDIPSKKK